MGMEWYYKFIIDNDVDTVDLLNVTRLYYTFGLNKQDEESFINPSVFLMEAEE
jgi:hypothetical protein